MVVVLDQMVRLGSKFAQREEGEGKWWRNMCQMVVVLDQMVRLGSKFAQREEGEGRRLWRNMCQMVVVLDQMVRLGNLSETAALNPVLKYASLVVVLVPGRGLPDDFLLFTWSSKVSDRPSGRLNEVLQSRGVSEKKFLLFTWSSKVSDRPSGRLNEVLQSRGVSEKKLRGMQKRNAVYKFDIMFGSRNGRSEDYSFEKN
ncbi:hypothetical protein QE152_g40161 [Popillia japonica]|uniref:Uncharacterized protein n=1 Tax=Popillia japonica TaxID=7064 RepID=A0AAW1HS84_POPJA